AGVLALQKRIRLGKTGSTGKDSGWGNITARSSETKESKITIQEDHSSSSSPSKANQETVSSADISGVGIGTVQRDNMQNTLNDNDGSEGGASQPDSASGNTQTSVDEDTSSNGGAPQVNTAADTDSAGSTTTALNNTDTKRRILAVVTAALQPYQLWGPTLPQPPRQPLMMRVDSTRTASSYPPKTWSRMLSKPTLQQIQAQQKPQQPTVKCPRQQATPHI
ncbi:mucin-associated surface protein (MASP), partial [Trypanosoma cruzi]